MSVLPRAALVAPLVLAGAARADDTCHVVNVGFTPAAPLQIVAWVETETGSYVDTLFVTKKIGTYGMGNRPGRFDFNSGDPDHDLWPYGRRITTFPIWSHRHGMQFPAVVFQNGDDNNLSHPFENSSVETAPPYCRPMMADETGWDTGTCATTAYTDKGVFATDGSTSGYPPRVDITRHAGLDSPSVDLYKMYDPFDGVSQATPPAGTCTQVTWPIPAGLASGNYVLWVEVARSGDMNASYNATTLPPPCVGGDTTPCNPPVIPWGDYGVAYRGQPSVVYKVPFAIGTGESRAAAQSYAGYGDPTGADGVVRPPDATITSDVPGSGASRLELIAGTLDRVVVDSRVLSDSLAPAAPTALAASAITASGATVTFVAPGDDGLAGSVSGYDIRIRAEDEMTADNFASSSPVLATVTPGALPSQCGGGQGGFPPAGTLEQVDLTGLMPETDYWIGVRAFDKCHNAGELAIYKLTTAAQAGGAVDACFVATAAYGSKMANDVELLRHFRDALLRRSVLGELAIETYYTFGPPVAGVVGQSELLRQAARAALSPIVAAVRGLAY
ncbi:MAG TPA: CFI-box-CTERM domain-containing protein [Kofleriaceae bacterium]|nr:CFI-box-CTERM domain-containing protein [Kofleriaceae bacterium]